MMQFIADLPVVAHNAAFDMKRLTSKHSKYWFTNSKFNLLL